MPKTPSGKQPNTLFSYFKKTPKAEENGDSEEILTPRKSPNSKKNSPTSAKKSSPKAKDVSIEWKVGDVVWCKLEGFPWWPSLVCNHPTQESHIKKSGRVTQIHVQFFEKNPTRAWIKEKYVHTFKGSQDASFQRGGTYFTLNTNIREGAISADKAIAMPCEERLSLIVELQPSSEEEEDDDEEEQANEKMVFDPEIFDTEMSDEETTVGKKKDESPSEKKENHSPENSANKLPSKSKRKAAKIAEMKSKRRKIIKSDSADEESGDDFKPAKDEDDDDDDDDSASSGVDEDDVSDDSVSEPDMSPVKKTKRKAPALKSEESSAKKSLISEKSIGSSPAVSANTKSRLSLFSAPETSKEGPSDTDGLSFTHLKYDFIQPEKIRDKMRKPKSDPEYNPRTLYVPESFLNQTTPAMRQWWVLKSERFDTVLFFKVGKFYELYHMDAVTGVNELGLIFMKGDWAHSGFPEIAYARYADALLQKGYKVARVEQTETPDMMQDRCRNMGRSTTKYDKVVKREVCQVNSQGVRTSTNLEGDVGDANNYILALCEKETSHEGLNVFGVCFIDTSIGTFHIGQFEDDRHLSRLRTLIAHYTPSQVLYERGKISAKALQLINDSLTSAIKEALASGTEFWESGKTLQRLSEEDYFKEEEKSEGSKTDWPPVLKKMLSDSDSLGLTASDSYNLAVRALGALTWYLQYCLVDHEMLSMKKFEEYLPVDKNNNAVKAATEIFDIKQRHMVLDGVTMLNLDIVRNSQTGTTDGSLLEKLNMCTSAFGKRLFHQWLCAPLCQPGAINDRLDAIDDLLGSKTQVDECILLMKKLPDLERLLGRIHTIGSTHRGSKHPDARAIMYEEVTYSKRKIEDFLSTIEGFKTAVAIINKFKDLKDQFKSRVLCRSVTIQDSENGQNGRFPNIAEDLDFFDQAFDQKKAKKDGTIVPSKGVDEDFDQAVSDISSVEQKLGEYLDSQKKSLGCRAIVYWGSGKNRYQMEIPESAMKNIPNSYELMSSKKGAKRFRTAKIDGLLVELTDAEERKDASLKDIMRRIFHSFDERHSKWIQVVECLAVLDVLISLSLYSRCSELSLCRPEMVLPVNGVDPMLELREGRHPCVSRTFEGGDFIPNDTLIGVNDDQDTEDGEYSKGQMVLVTGPNMGGKSTLMRQVGLIVVMAQMGCYVPAEKCKLTPVDRIFTRLGASDRIMAGESTFFVELSETSSILQHATKHSLVLLDELGRGTATYDGTAIASSVVKELSDKIGCRTLFSTHYHSLVEDYKSNKKIQLGHMACMVENENEEDPSQETITFLYKFVKGACPKSYGFNAARLAGILEDVIQCALKKAKQFEEDVEGKKHFRDLWHCPSADNLDSLVLNVRSGES